MAAAVSCCYWRQAACVRGTEPCLQLALKPASGGERYRTVSDIGHVIIMMVAAGLAINRTLSQV